MKNNVPSKIDLEAEICKRSLYQFVKRSFHIVEPSEMYIDGWHIKTICEHLEMAYNGSIRNLLINIPPRHMKSLLVSVFFPAWVWTKSPGKKFLYTSYSDTFAVRDSIKCRNLITSQWYQDRFDLKLSADQNQTSKYTNTVGGHRISAGVGGQSTGEGGDFVVADDPLKAQDATSDAEINAVNSWWDDTMSTRSTPNTGVKIIIQQRLNENDLTGHLLRGNVKQTHLVLPFEFEFGRCDTDIRTEPNSILWPERFSEDELTLLKSSLSSFGVASQLQQRPSPVGGHIYKKEWFTNRYAVGASIAKFISLDTAATISTTSARTACVVFELLPDYRIRVCDAWAKKLEFTELNAEVEQTIKIHANKLLGVIVENKSSGISLIQTLKQSLPPNISKYVVPFNPNTDKITRGALASKWCENGCVLLPVLGTVFDLEEELFSFPNGNYKDYPDAFSQGILYLEHYLSQGYKTRNTPANFRR